jgi:hypothetical protein
MCTFGKAEKRTQHVRRNFVADQNLRQTGPSRWL